MQHDLLPGNATPACHKMQPGYVAEMSPFPHFGVVFATPLDVFATFSEKLATRPVACYAAVVRLPRSPP